MQGLTATIKQVSDFPSMLMIQVVKEHWSGSIHSHGTSPTMAGHQNLVSSFLRPLLMLAVT